MIVQTKKESGSKFLPFQLSRLPYLFQADYDELNVVNRIQIPTVLMNVTFNTNCIATNIATEEIKYKESNKVHHEGNANTTKGSAKTVTDNSENERPVIEQKESEDKPRTLPNTHCKTNRASFTGKLSYDCDIYKDLSKRQRFVFMSAFYTVLAIVALHDGQIGKTMVSTWDQYSLINLVII